MHRVLFQYKVLKIIPNGPIYYNIKFMRLINYNKICNRFKYNVSSRPMYYNITFNTLKYCIITSNKPENCNTLKRLIYHNTINMKLLCI